MDNAAHQAKAYPDQAADCRSHGIREAVRNAHRGICVGRRKCLLGGDLDLLYEILLKSGYPLTTAVTTVELVGKKAYSVADGTLIVCLERELTLDLIRAIADLAPERVVCLDEGFEGNDQLKANAVQTFKTKGVPSFKTV